MIVTTVVLTNAAQAKSFPLSMPITYVCSHTSDLEPQLRLEPKWRSMELVKQYQQDLRTATQFRHGAWRVLTLQMPPSGLLLKPARLEAGSSRALSLAAASLSCAETPDFNAA